jgi:rare lipoprotein A
MVDPKGGEVGRTNDLTHPGAKATATQILDVYGGPWKTNSMAEATKHWPEVSGASRSTAVSFLQNMNLDYPTLVAAAGSTTQAVRPRDGSVPTDAPDARAISPVKETAPKVGTASTDATKQARIENAQKIMSDPTATPQEKLAAAVGDYNDLPKDAHGNAVVKLQDGGKEREFHIEVSKVGGGRSLVNVYGLDDKGHQRIAFRGIENKDGSFEQQQMPSGKPASFEGSWWSQHMPGSTVGQSGTPEQPKPPGSAVPIPEAPRQPDAPAPETPRQPDAPIPETPRQPDAPIPETPPKPAPGSEKPIGPVHHGRVSNYGGPEDQGHKRGGDRGSRTASGDRLDPDAMTAASRTLPFGTKVRVTDEHTGKSVVVTINDRGPYHRTHGKRGPYDRDLDLSHGAAIALGNTGTPYVKWQVVTG